MCPQNLADCCLSSNEPVAENGGRLVVSAIYILPAWFEAIGCTRSDSFAQMISFANRNLPARVATGPGKKLAGSPQLAKQMRESHCEPINQRVIMTTKPSKISEEATVQDLVAFLCSKVTSLSPGQRYMLGVTGCPGAGKSTVSEWLVNGVNEKLPDRPAMVVPMDGFHFSNEQLKEMKLLEFKGIPDSFDAARFVDLLRRLRAITDKNVYCPLFDRSIEASIEDAIVIEPKNKLCVVEGNYLLVKEKPWDGCRSYFDQVWFIDVTFDTVMPRLLARHVHGGRTQEGARAKIESTDLPNANLIEQTKPYADRLIRLATRQS